MSRDGSSTVQLRLGIRGRPWKERERETVGRGRERERESLFLINIQNQQGMVAHACNPSYLGG